MLVNNHHPSRKVVAREAQDVWPAWLESVYAVALKVGMMSSPIILRLILGDETELCECIF